MRNCLILLVGISIGCWLGGCCEKALRDPEEGVSRELALQRKRDIGDLRYRLSFSIPEMKTEEVSGRVEILFSQSVMKPVVLDFRENAAHIRGVRVNDRQIEVKVVNEHIVIPAKHLLAGENAVEIDFIAGDRSLNRNEEYLYTLLVPERARTLFPCFDQPDLKARFTLELEIPEKWVAVANAPALHEKTGNGRKRIRFAETEPLSTYLFAFVAGAWQRADEIRDGRTISLYYRETDPAKVAQSAIIFDQVFASLTWLEEYTGISYPFQKYDLVIVPGFQFGGMEHPGAVLYNDKRMYLGPRPTVEEELGRMELIAHETTHMWFGDAVTMAWFDDVWTKEVFANYFAARMTEPQFPRINHRLNDLRNFYISAYSEDRTAGSTSIKQPLANLQDAGLIYGQIIYDKAPIVMKMLAETMGEEAFRQGIREYLRTYVYGNATWEELIAILDKYTPDDLKSWSQVWVNEKGMPEITLAEDNRTLTVRQRDPWSRGIVWPQQLTVGKVRKAENLRYRSYMITDSVMCIPLESPVDYVLPNLDGKAYGYFALNPGTADFCLGHFSDFTDRVARLSLIITLNENAIQGQIDERKFALALLKLLKSEEDPLIISTSVAYIKGIALRGNGAADLEKELRELAGKPHGPGCQQAAFRALVEVATLPQTTGELYRIWKEQKPFPGLILGENDYMRMAYELAVRMPEKYEELKEIQTKRMTDPDRSREFRFIVRALSPVSAVRDSLFHSLLSAENRKMEPWVVQVMYYLNHPLRQQEAVKYILPALNELQEIQRTGDIFFPKNWVSACLKGHTSPEAAAQVRLFLEERPDYPVLLKNKILQSADHLLRSTTN